MSEEQMTGRPLDPEMQSAVQDVIRSMQKKSTPTPLVQDDNVMAGLEIDGQELLAQVPLDEPIEEEIPRIERDPDVTFKREKPKNPWARYFPELGLVEVTEGEKEIFYRQFLNNDRISFPISVNIGLDRRTVQMRNLTPYEREIVAICVERIVESHPVTKIDKANLANDYLVKLNMILQILAVEGEEWEPYTWLYTPEQLPEETEDVTKLQRIARLRFVNSHRFIHYFRALQLFEIKRTILEDAVANRDFWIPAGSA
jgi:hypothetical protein